jgi:hypothetical protein
MRKEDEKERKREDRVAKKTEYETNAQKIIG